MPIVCLSSVDWDFSWQIPHEVASAFARAGHRVLFVDNTGVRRPHVADAERVYSRLRNRYRTRGGVRRTSEGVEVFSPLIVPLPYSRAACHLNASAIVHVIRRWLDDGRRNGGNAAPIVITFLPTPLARAIIGHLDPSLLVYYCTDRLAESSPEARPIEQHERLLVREADLVFVTSTGLLEYIGTLTPRVAMLAAGVQFGTFRAARAHGDELPAPLRSLPRPIVGYVGSLRAVVDRAMLAHAARVMPEASFALIGPIMADIRELAACRNVWLPGPMSHTDIVRCMSAFDVGIIPYVINAFTSSLMPMKLKEYLAAGLPIVSTELPEVQRFDAEHGPLVTFAQDPATFAGAIRVALADREPAVVARRLAVAQRYDWPGRIALMRRSMEEALAAEGSGYGAPEARRQGSPPSSWV
jgi:glycosyltransferase involved in cell wall biosynthesis